MNFGENLLMLLPSPMTIIYANGEHITGRLLYFYLARSLSLSPAECVHLEDHVNSIRLNKASLISSHFFFLPTSLCAFACLPNRQNINAGPDHFAAVPFESKTSFHSAIIGVLYTFPNWWTFQRNEQQKNTKIRLVYFFALEYVRTPTASIQRP